MDGGPFRVPRPTDRRVASRPEPTHRQQAEEPRSVNETPKTVHQAATPRHAMREERSVRRFVLPIIVAVILIILGVVGWFAWSKTQTVVTAIDSSKYQAVFFTNGQVYFGKLQSFNNEYMKLTDIYYLQSQQSTEEAKDSKNPQQTSNDQGNVQLIKLGDEIHGPEDEMILSKDQVLFYENLKTDGKVAQSIEKYKKP